MYYSRVFFLIQLFCEKSHRVRIFVLHIRDSSTKNPPVALEPKTFKTKSIIYLLFDGNHWPFDLKRKHYVVDGRNSSTSNKSAGIKTDGLGKP